MFGRVFIFLGLVFGCLLLQGSAFAVKNPPPKSTKYQAQDFKRNIDKIVNMYAGRANVGIEIVSLKSGLRLYGKNENNLFIPASCLKLFTGATALSTLGANYQFATTVWTDGKIEGCLLKGNIYLKGSGDPELMAKDLEEMVFSLKLQGVEKIAGNLIVDNSDFDGVSQGPGWMWDDEPEYWNSPMDALTVNHSCLQLFICPAEECSQPAKIFVTPKTAFVNVENLASTIEDKDSNIAVFRKVNQNKNWIQIKGAISKTSEPIAYAVSLDHPHLYAGYVFADVLMKQNISLAGAVEQGKVPSSAEQIAEHLSRPLSLIVQKMMKESDNLYADCLFKKTGQVRYGKVGTWSNASQAVREFLHHRVGLNTSEMVVLDGSGVSRYNLVSPRQFVEFLTEVKNSYDYSSEFLSALPVAGVDGSLKHAMSDALLFSKVRAKSGSMKGVRTVSGYATTRDGEDLAFSIMINGFIEPRSSDARLENEVCKFLVNYTRE
jgi:D-alanyl-D-alanine carboxypeptidase/D-alanyl-D-alanine-endopeptidase (penicillin-binding protein 4)